MKAWAGRTECDGCQKEENSIALEHGKRKRAGRKYLFFNMGATNYPCVCRRTKLPERGVHSEKVRETGS